MLNLLDRTFDRLYSSKYNPLYRSGTIAIALLAIVIVTGFYLLFVYRLSAPYESMHEIQNSFSHVIRSLHRYASDLCVVVVVFHVIRMLIEGKYWGPRTLAWITGVFLMLLLLIIGWTGFVLVWDRHAQGLAQAGAKIADVIPFLTGTLTRSVSGAATVGTSFFFLNLFLHMSLPLGMLVLLWLHTSKLQQPGWFLPRNIFLVFTAILLIYSVLVPAPLGPQADLLNFQQDYSINWFYGFLIPMVHILSAKTTLLVMFGFFVLMLTVPWWLRPKLENRPKISMHNQAACTGCTQCEQDCPFSAIEMIPRTQGSGSDVVASVDALSCVGCGICSASCTQMAIGPEDKSSRLQMQAIKQLKTEENRGGHLYIHCQKNALGKTFLASKISSQQKWADFAIDCTGNLHVATTYFALGHFSEVTVIGCPAHACVNRLGQKLLEDRFLHGREPKVSERMDYSKVKIFSGSPEDLDDLRQFDQQKKSHKEKKWKKKVAATASSAVLLGAVGYLSGFPYQDQIKNSLLRIAVRFPAETIEKCVERTPEDLAKLPKHMRTSRTCQKTVMSYLFEVKVGSEVKYSKLLTPKGIHGDKPIVIEQDIELSEAQHRVFASLVPVDSSELASHTIEFEDSFKSGRVTLLYYDIANKRLMHSNKALK